MLCVYIQNCASCVGGEYMFIKNVKTVRRKLKNGTEECSMASLMGICGGLVGPKSGNVKNRWVSPLLFEGSREPRGI